jgi:hypothetical protein
MAASLVGPNVPDGPLSGSVVVVCMPLSTAVVVLRGPESGAGGVKPLAGGGLLQA